MTTARKTVDVWEFWFDYGYGDGWECEIIEDSRDAMRENLKAYRGAGWFPRIRKRRVHRDRLASHDPKRP